MIRLTMREAARASTAKSRHTLQPTRKNITTSKKPKEEPEVPVMEEKVSPAKPMKASRKRASSRPSVDIKPMKKVKTQAGADENKVKTEDDGSSPPPLKTKKSASADLQAKKLKAYSQYANQSPFPTFLHPTAAEAKLGHRILQKLHGVRSRPEEVIASTTRAGCGDSPSVLDALVRTILSQNTSDTNSTRAKLSMDKAYGRSDKWDAIVEGGQAKLQEAIKCGGLSQVKSKVIISILQQVKAKYGVYSLDHLHEASSEDAMAEMLAFQGVGPKTASCVLLFCLKRESFAVDTHVWRITGLLGWRPKEASRDETHAHLDMRIPDEDKYGLHILLVSHGKKCEECKAGGRVIGKCELRKAFRKGKLEGDVGEDAKQEELKKLKDEGVDVKKVKAEEVEGLEQSEDIKVEENAGNLKEEDVHSTKVKTEKPAEPGAQKAVKEERTEKPKKFKVERTAESKVERKW